jgi:hypothetical protein
MAHSWAKGTHKLYQGKIRFLRRFEETFGVPVLSSRPLLLPPISDEIPLGWAQLSYSLQLGRRKDTEGQRMTLSYGTIRQLRSAASQYMAWDMMFRHPRSVYLDHSRHLIQQPCRATDSLGATMFPAGMKARIGDESRPSVALLDRQVRYLDNDLALCYATAKTDEARHEISLAGLANTSLWLGWLHSSENFNLPWEYVNLVEPKDGPTVDLPRGVGVVQYFMRPKTKSNRSQVADVVIAGKTMLGYRLSRWVHHARDSSGHGADWMTDSSLVFCHQDGSPWTSEYFRYRYLYPSLEAQRETDPLLRAFNGTPGNSIPEMFWSLYCYRRGARSHVSRGSRSVARYRHATEAQVYDHGRWRRQRGSERVDIMYREWLVRDRIKLTLYLM